MLEKLSECLKQLLSLKESLFYPFVFLFIFQGAVMLELLKDSVSVTILSSGFSCQHHPHDRTVYLRRISCQQFRCSVYINSVIKSNRWCAIMPDLRIISMRQPGTRQNCLLRPVWIEKSRIDMNMVANVDAGPVCEEGEGKELIRGGDEGFEASIFEQTLPPWGDVAIQKDRDIEPRCVGLPESNSTPTTTLNETRVHFLEETDEEQLSKRLLLLSRTNKVRSAFELFRSMEWLGLSPNLHACNSLLSCLLRNGLLEDGLRLFEFMKTKQITTRHTYSIVLKAVANSRGCDAALEMFMELRGECEARKDFDAIVYNTMITVCCKVNNWVEAERIWNCMKANGCCATRVTYCLLVSNFVRSGQTELAIDAYSQMVRNGFKPGTDTMQAIISVCTKEGNWSLALGVFQDILKGGLKPNPIACNALINCLGKAGELKLAFKVYDIMRSLGHSPDSYTWKALLGALYKEDRHNDVLWLFEIIKRDQGSLLSLHLFNTALMSCSKLGSWDRALQLLWQMEASGLLVPTESYNLVISACEIARKPKVALQVYQHMVYQKRYPDTFTHLSLLRGCIWGSLWDEVEEILNRATPNVSLYNAVIQGMCLRGKTESAKKLYMKMRENDLQPDGKTRALMLQNLPSDSASRRNRRLFRYGQHGQKIKRRKGKR
ncbi:hypothetical protein F2P56_021679 [Juglans regia]|uniref:Pentatricopeptide repeat-containing protein-mitochondrial domain-containing protein n=4 Tax=Juglans regia TaxID=51240 RepID=A0A833UP68_JUGRE|nr:pentatricopeptide repeat-containing protein At3g29290 isoform X1 [Juglans regia]KAF5457588.1 hypothetical protein F2P56_021679 [Juglans regia]